MKACTLSCIRRESCPLRLQAISSCDIFSIAFSIDRLLFKINLAFSEKKPPFSLSFSRVTSSEPVAMVLIVSEIVFFFLAFSAFFSCSA